MASNTSNLLTLKCQATSKSVSHSFKTQSTDLLIVLPQYLHAQLPQYREYCNILCIVYPNKWQHILSLTP